MNRILIIDNDVLIRWSLERILTQEGYVIDTAATTEDAYAFLRRNDYKILFIDVQINETENIHALIKIKELQPALQIVILSAHPANQIKPLLESVNIYAIIEKPFKAEQIKSLTKDIFKG
ncbi:MAG: hypothetical protein A2Y62_06500 [Candidatus Fischerbacteria bacterium RBG_13_37_8]|uniref:Response regulatory domain-containing protein n=1 Tax=Candidatus Fischerbacteria bacterium RBG_13_37_8 TaxID=1817863 RepID=A0A1F5VEE5_9BACT|nr:MAG: hypothetical protein A2Y62_06500 [Candidatus Fischerbacteria bacterium RBG_13_37_8]